jgi:ATP-dependent protease Clp ATPase subunit
MQNMPVSPISYGPPVRTPQRFSGPGIERIKRSELPSLIQSRGSSAKLLVIKEMKTKFREITEKNKGFSVTGILKPMSEDELKDIVLSDEELKRKEEIAINNQIKRFKKKQEQKEKKVKLKKLNKPK